MQFLARHVVSQLNLECSVDGTPAEFCAMNDGDLVITLGTGDAAIEVVVSPTDLPKLLAFLRAKP